MSQAVYVLSIWVICMCYFTVFMFTEYPQYKVNVGGPVIYMQTYLNTPVIGSQSLEDYPFPNCEEDFCSWKYTMNNEEFISRYPDNPLLYVDADRDLNTFIDSRDPPLRCIPESFGYSEHEAAKIFPYIGYPTCPEKMNTYQSIIQIHTNRTLTMNCPNGKGWYYLGIPPNQEKLGFDSYKGEGHMYKGPVTLTHDEEWAYGTCEENKSTLLEGATYTHQPKPEVITRAKNIMQDMQKQAEQKYQETNTRPLTVLMLVFDSISRKHFYRKLPKTVEYLNNLDSSKFRVNDFKIQNVMGDNSLPNVYPVWTGKEMPNLSSSKKNSNKSKEEDMIGEKAIWNHLRDTVRIMQGWATLFGAEFCDNYFAFATGRKPEVDHLMQEFWCAAERLSGFK